MNVLLPSFILYMLLFAASNVHGALEKPAILDLKLTQKWYQNMLHQRPVLTKSVTASCIAVLSDTICQKMEAKAKINPRLRNQAEERKQVINDHDNSEPMPLHDDSAWAISHDWRRTRDVAIIGFLCKSNPF